MLVDGGHGIDVINNALNALLGVVAAALFVACVILLIKQFTNDEDGLLNKSYSIKRITGMLGIVLTMVFLARTGTALANNFSAINPVDANDGRGTVLITNVSNSTSADHKWSNGQQAQLQNLSNVTGTSSTPTSGYSENWSVEQIINNPDEYLETVEKEKAQDNGTTGGNSVEFGWILSGYEGNEDLYKNDITVGEMIANASKAAGSLADTINDMSVQASGEFPMM